jgi:DNA-binding Xre family transcriptional regulator
MATSYNKLWKLLIDKKMSKADLRKVSGVSPNTMTKLRRDEPVMLSVLDKICKVLDVNYGDIADYIADTYEGEDKNG